MEKEINIGDIVKVVDKGQNIGGCTMFKISNKFKNPYRDTSFMTIEGDEYVVFGVDRHEEFVAIRHLVDGTELSIGFRGLKFVRPLDRGKKRRLNF